MATHAMAVRITAPGATAAAGAVRQVADQVRQLRLQQAHLRTQQASSTAQTAAVRHGTALIQQQRQALSLQQAQERADRQQQSRGPGSAILKAAASSRVNLGPVSPLIGQTLQALASLGPEGLAAAAALAALAGGVALAITAAEKFAEMIDAASKTLKEFSDARITTGGNTGNVAFLRAFGLDPGQIGGVAGSLRERLSSNPFAMSAGHQLGLSPVLSRSLRPGMDESQLVKNVVQALAGIDDPLKRFQKAVQLDAQALLPSVEFYRRHRDVVDKDAAAIDAINKDPGFQEAASDVQAQLDRMRANFMEVVVAFSKPFMKPIADFLGRLADKLRDLALWVNNNQVAIGKLRDGLVTLAVGFTELGMGIGKNLENWGEALKQLTHGVLGGPESSAGKVLYDASKTMKDLIAGGGQGGLGSALNANTAALQNNTVALKSGTFGGGDRTRRALQQRMPGTWGPQAFDNAVAGSAYRLGAF